METHGFSICSLANGLPLLCTKKSVSIFLELQQNYVTCLKTKTSDEIIHLSHYSNKTVGRNKRQGKDRGWGLSWKAFTKLHLYSSSITLYLI